MTRSAIRSIGAFVATARSTARTIPATTVSPPTLVARTRRMPQVLSEPAVT